jgi:basic amino acid/polyamine antiporter, APA family
MIADPNTTSAATQLAPKLGRFDATMIVMGGIVGSGIFINPYVVAQRVHSSALILAAWVAGGALALIGAFIYAELAVRLPKVGGEYAYLREGIHPAVGFFYGWVALIVINAGGCAAVAVTFAKYLRELVPVPFPERAIAVTAIGVLAAVNCVGVRAGSAVQSLLMLLRSAAIVMLVTCGSWWLSHARETSGIHWSPLLDRPMSSDLAAAFASAMIPVFFAYGGWQTASFVAAEVREPRRNLPRALLLGMVGVIVLYLTVNLICVWVLGPADLAATSTPASTVMQRVAGETGARLLAVGISISTFGFLSQSVLTYPRVLFAMAADGLFPSSLSRVHPRSQTPIVAIVVNSVLTIAVVLIGRYDQILTYVESMDLVFFGLTAITLFVFRHREKSASTARGAPSRDFAFRVPGHPWSTLVFIAACFLVVLNTLLRNRGNTMIIGLILLVGALFYLCRRALTNQQAVKTSL